MKKKYSEAEGVCKRERMIQLLLSFFLVVAVATAAVVVVVVTVFAVAAVFTCFYCLYFYLVATAYVVSGV